LRRAILSYNETIEKNELSNDDKIVESLKKEMNLLEDKVLEIDFQIRSLAEKYFQLDSNTAMYFENKKIFK
jgi:uncharacterized membrane protein